MAVIIDGWDKLPQNCYDCDLHNYHECALTSNSIEDYYNGETREPSCPLKEAPIGKWIPVSERLPKEKDYSRCAENYDGAVYWCTDKGVIGIGWYYEDTKSWAWLDDTFPDHWGKVVAWIPLPKPYKMEREDKE